jgi:hypothetical protein
VLTAASGDKTEATRVLIELEAMRQSCRDIAARYNADAAKINRSIFMGNGVPPALDDTACNA